MVQAREQQAGLSLWTPVAIAQSLFWFFCLPELCKPWWENAWIDVSPLKAEVALNSLGLPFFVLYALCSLPIYYAGLVCSSPTFPSVPAQAS